MAGSKVLIKECHRARKMYGGGMRQAGILAAGGLWALDHHRARLGEDHANAKAFVEALVGAKHLRIDASRVHTNIVMIDLERGTTAQMIERAKAQGVLLGAALVGAVPLASEGVLSSQRIRAVMHLDVDRDSVVRAAKIIAELAAQL